MWASYHGHEDVAIALAERGADLNIKNKVSDCQLYIHDDEDVVIDYDDGGGGGGYDGYDAGVSTTLVAFVYMHAYQYLCMNVYLCTCVCVYRWTYVHIYVCAYLY